MLDSLQERELSEAEAAEALKEVSDSEMDGIED